MNAKSILVKGLRELGADGLCLPELDCGCGLDDLAPCETCDLRKCLAAKRHEDGLYWEM
jgi:hypothetical protein